MNIKDFLIDNYIYIIIVIVLIIITIIGFLADKKSKVKNADKDILPNNNANNGSVNYGNVQQNQAQPMNYQPVAGTNEVINSIPNSPLITNNVPTAPINMGQLPNNIVNPVPSDINNSINPVASAIANDANQLNVLPGAIQGTIVNQNLNSVSQMTNQPVIPSSPEPVGPSTLVNPEPMYQPAASQTPVIAPSDPIANMQNYNQAAYNNGVEQLNNMQGNTMPMGINMAPLPNDPVNNVPTTYSEPVAVMPVADSAPIPTPVEPVQPVAPIQPVVNTQVNPVPIPTPVEPVQPVMPIPAAPSVPVNPAPIPSAAVPNMGTTPQPVSNSQLNFVYGNQQGNQNNNNGYMQ